ncbi:MAG: nucleotidyltransferase [Chitinophagaceae bacterium]|jgi:predicted nucleotidyltransferase|nr:nucleotidyltransferase [Chitinophagaceae bacterium]
MEQIIGNIFNQDFREFLNALNNNKVKYLLVGGYSVILHGYSRTTGDMDIWVDRTKENYVLLNSAFEEFGMPIFDMTLENFISHPEWDVFTYGKPPVAIDILINLKGVNFDFAFNNSIVFDLDGLPIRTIHKNDLITAKMAANRAKDQNDLENLI